MDQKIDEKKYNRHLKNGRSSLEKTQAGGSQSPPPPPKKVPEKRPRVSRKDFDVHDLSGVAEPKLVCTALIELPVAPKGRDAA